MAATKIATSESTRPNGRGPVLKVTRYDLVTSTLLAGIIGLTVIQNELLFITGVSLLGFALFAVRPVVHSWMMDITPTRWSGSATSLMFGTQAILSAAVPIIGGIVADHYGLAAVFYLLAGSMLIANVLVYFLPGEDRASGVRS